MQLHLVNEKDSNSIKRASSFSKKNSELSERANIDRFSTVSVCLDGSSLSEGVIPHAKLLASALQANVQFLHVLESDHDAEVPPDPVEWSFRRREMRDYLERLTAEYQLDDQSAEKSTEICVLEGKSATVIGNCSKDPERTISVFCRKDNFKSGHIGATSRTVLECCARSVLLIPAGKATSDSAHFKRILVPLDGSPRAESILPSISGIAKYCGATVIIVHAAQYPHVLSGSTGDADTQRLKSALNEHNRAAAIPYLNRIGRLLRESGVDVEEKVVSDGDPRRQLIDAVKTESIDLIAHSSHGSSGHADMPFGDVAGHLMSHSPVPILMLRDLSLARSGTALNNLSRLVANRSPKGDELPI